MRIYLGQFSPKTNMTCQETGKPFGPNMQKKVGYQVVAEHEGMRRFFKVYGRTEAMKVRDRLEKEVSGEDSNE